MTPHVYSGDQLCALNRDHCRKLSALSYDPLTHSRHNAGDRRAKVCHEIRLQVDSKISAQWCRGVMAATTDVRSTDSEFASRPGTTAQPYRQAAHSLMPIISVWCHRCKHLEGNGK